MKRQDRLSEMIEEVEAELMVKYGRLVYSAPGLSAAEEEWRADRYGPPCSLHPDAPHGFDRNASHSAGRYVCECEGWVGPAHQQ